MKKLLFFAVGAFFMLFTACNTESVSLEGSWIIETAYGQPVIVADTAMITFDTKEMRVAGCNGFCCGGAYAEIDGTIVENKTMRFSVFKNILD